MKKITARVYWNKKNGQGRVHIPKRCFEIMPKEIEIKVPKEFLKKEFLRNGK